MQVDQIVDRFNYAVSLHKQGMLQEALKIYTEINDKWPNIGLCYHHAGAIHWSLGDKALALEMLRKAIDLDPKNSAIRQSLLLYLVEAGLPHEATRVLEDAMARGNFVGRDVLEWTFRLASERQKYHGGAPVPLADVEDPDFYEILGASWRFSMSSCYGLTDSYYSLYEMVKYVTKYKIPGDIVECGVYAGGMALLAALTLLRLGDTSRNIYLYDTFEGMPPPTEEDGQLANATYAKQTANGEAWAAKSIEDVSALLYASGYPAEKLHFVKGLVENTIPLVGPEKISILRIDTDFYSSVKHVLNNFYPRVSSGGCLIIDDYGYMPGCRLAVDEYFDSIETPMCLHRVNTTVRTGIKL